MKKILPILLLLIFIFNSCKKDENNPEQSETPTTFVKEENEIIAVNENTITLTGNQNEIKKNDIVVSGANGNAPNGFLRKVISINTSNGNTILETQRTTVSEAIKYYFDDGEEHQDNFNYTFSDADVSGRSTSETEIIPISIDIDESITTNQGGIPLELHLTGNLTIKPSIVGNIKLSRHNLTPVFDEFLFSISTENEFNISLNSEFNTSFDTEDIILGKFEGAPITLYVGIPVVIRPQFALYIGANGDLTANIIYTYNNNSTSFAGVTYSDGWQYLPENGFTVNSQNSTATASATGNLKAYIKPEFSLALYDNSIVSAGINVKPYSRFEASVTSTEYYWGIYGGIDTGAYFKAFDFGFSTLIDETWDNLIEIPEWEIASGYNNIATITNPSPAPAETITEQPINFSWQANDFTDTPTFKIFLGIDENSLTSIGTTTETTYTAPNTYAIGNYYWKIVATKSNGDFITESNIYSFIINEISSEPTVTTNAITNITQTSATSGGNVTDDGGNNITAKGVCWSTNSNPTIADNTTNDGTSTGNFTSSITDLLPNTTYYVRAYATNSAGTAYGNEIEFTTLTTTTNPPVADFIADQTNITEDTTVNFTDTSTNIPTSWSWSFPGGTPSSSTDQNPSVTYNTAGTYDVTLTATNANGSNTETKTGYITVTSGGTGTFPGQTVLVNGGTFQMGQPDPNIWCTDCSNDEQPVHSVTISNFRISKYEITNQQYADFMNAIGANSNGSYNDTGYLDMNTSSCQIDYIGGQFVPQSGKENYPVIVVSWYGAKAYAEYYGGRLPTEAEWEFAARGGNNSNGYTYSGSDNIDDVAWYWDNSDATGNSNLYSGHGTLPIGTKNANELGIYDMSGNVWEWCNDWYDSGYYNNSPSSDPQGPSTGTHHVNRGGSWGSHISYCRVADRSKGGPAGAGHDLGFRPVFAP